MKGRNHDEDCDFRRDGFYRQAFDKRLNRPGTSRLYFNKKTG
ncbi:hypothetical protein CHCC19467_1716 [Bacillus paralicheniformis]|nr:hypothetical protein CHCC19467_1716 [Bacillus paralicheniformis]TWN36459.1 hypothetical protein CHCC14527_0399 [Bacillus paralicheniformis]TWN61301.1 hypothetical protein CHCC14427_0046 [Bacillus paralicheniformis]